MSSEAITILLVMDRVLGVVGALLIVTGADVEHDITIHTQLFTVVFNTLIVFPEMENVLFSAMLVTELFV